MIEAALLTLELILVIILLVEVNKSRKIENYNSGLFSYKALRTDVEDLKPKKKA